MSLTAKPVPCYCDAYTFPHRTGGGRCQQERDNPIIKPEPLTLEELNQTCYYTPRLGKEQE